MKLWKILTSVIICVIGLACVLLIAFRHSMESPKHEKVDVYVNSTAKIAETSDDYICATLDWWPPDKCDYGTCSWGMSTLLDLDLNNTILSNAVKAFSPLKIRLGGTLQDKLIYQTNEQQPCNTFARDYSQLLNFSQGCLPMSRWDDLNNFFNDTGAVVYFGLNALNGRIINTDGTTTGAWDPTNAEFLMNYTISKGYNIYGWELGNELSGKGVGASVPVEQYVADIKTLENLIEKLYVDSNTKPIVLGPGGFFDQTWFTEFINKTTKSVQAITHHIYDLGPGSTSNANLLNKITNPLVLNGVAGVFSTLQQEIRNSGTSAVAWVGEAGGAFNSGHDHITNAFAMSFWYLDQLGMAATYGTDTFCRQTLIGGNYGLLDRSTLVPNPDYYSALLWNKLMGKQVLSTSVSGSGKLRAYTHCSKQSQGITLLLINLEPKVTLRVTISAETGSIPGDNKVPSFAQKSKFEKLPLMSQNTREEYHLTTAKRELTSRRMLLNGKPLTVDSSGVIPTLNPTTVDMKNPVSLAPFSIAFVHLPGMISDACK